MGLMHQRDRLRALLWSLDVAEVRCIFDEMRPKKGDYIVSIMQMATAEKVDALLASFADSEECEKTGGTP